VRDRIEWRIVQNCQRLASGDAEMVDDLPNAVDAAHPVEDVVRFAGVVR
jgi:hypothetical protein